TARTGTNEGACHAGANKARALAQPLLAQWREAVGLRSLREAPRAVDAGKSERGEKPALQPVVFRENDAFAFKVLDAKKTVLATQGGFGDPKAAMAAARDAMEKIPVS